MTESIARPDGTRYVPRKPPEAEWLDPGPGLDLAVFVRRTHDANLARTLALTAIREYGYETAESILADAVPEVGWFRVVPWCNCGDGHTSEVQVADPGSRGAFPGIMFVRYPRRIG